MIYLPIYKTTTTPNNMFLLGDLAAGILKTAAITNETYEYIDNRIICNSDITMSLLPEWYNTGCKVWDIEVNKKELLDILQYIKEVGIIYIYNPVCEYIIVEPLKLITIKEIEQWIKS